MDCKKISANHISNKRLVPRIYTECSNKKTGLLAKMEAYIDTLCFLAQPKKKDTNQFKNKNQPELPDNQTVRKSNNQAVKEEIFIQTCRKGGGR